VTTIDSNPTETGWNLADVWETIAEGLGDALAQQQGARQISWTEMNRRANGVAAALLAAPGAAEQDKIAQYLYNCPEYLESTFAAFKAGCATVNTNYRYAADELVYLWDNGDVTTVVFHGTFVDQIEAIRSRVPRITTWLWVDDGAGPCPDWAMPYEVAAATT
jgi:acyl-CoA synthetase (AMP-forming)/AMP-acid ligase II